MSTCTTPLSSTSPSRCCVSAVELLEFRDEVLDAVRDLLAFGHPLALDALEQVELAEHVVERAALQALFARAERGLDFLQAALERRVVRLEARDHARRAIDLRCQSIQALEFRVHELGHLVSSPVSAFAEHG